MFGAWTLPLPQPLPQPPLFAPSTTVAIIITIFLATVTTITIIIAMAMVTTTTVILVRPLILGWLSSIPGDWLNRNRQTDLGTSICHLDHCPEVISKNCGDLFVGAEINLCRLLSCNRHIGGELVSSFAMTDLK